MKNLILSTAAAATLLMIEATTAPAHAGPKDGFIPLPPPIFGGVSVSNTHNTTWVKPVRSDLTVSLDYSPKSSKRTADSNKAVSRMERAKSRIIGTYNVSAPKREFRAPKSFPDGSIPYPPPVPDEPKYSLFYGDHGSVWTKALDEPLGVDAAIADFWQRASGDKSTNWTADFWSNKFDALSVDLAAIPFPPDGVIPR